MCFHLGLNKGLSLIIFYGRRKLESCNQRVSKGLRGKGRIDQRLHLALHTVSHYLYSSFMMKLNALCKTEQSITQCRRSKIYYQNVRPKTLVRKRPVALSIHCAIGRLQTINNTIGARSNWHSMTKNYFPKIPLIDSLYSRPKHRAVIVILCCSQTPKMQQALPRCKSPHYLDMRRL